jgi:hypothetical protein
MKSYKIIKILFTVFLIFLAISVILWRLQLKKPYNIYILDKTVLDKERVQHKSFSWILNYDNYTLKNYKHYSYKKDYYGFFPIHTSQTNHEYKIRSLSLSEVLTVPADLDMVYYADNYGVSYQDWYKRPPDQFHSPLIYGGLNQNDFLLLLFMKQKNKLIISEYNMLGPPTSNLIRSKTETLFDFTWTGWIGCYFESLSNTDNMLPNWVVELYEKKNKQKWAFSGTGIVLVQEQGDILVLESKTHLTNANVQIVTSDYAQNIYKLPKIQNYKSWFDIIKTGTANKSLAHYQISVNSHGEALLKQYRIEKEFPAVIEHLDKYKFYYFAGDFSNRNIAMASSYCKGLPILLRLLYTNDTGSKQAFFWRYYVPLMQNILANNLQQNRNLNK